MSHPSRLLLALFATLAVAGVVESRFMAPGHASDHLVRSTVPAPSQAWVAALR